MNITSTSGEIVLNEMNEEKDLFVESGSGDITLSYSKAPQSLELSLRYYNKVKGFKKSQRRFNKVENWKSIKSSGGY